MDRRGKCFNSPFCLCCKYGCTPPECRNEQNLTAQTRQKRCRAARERKQSESSRVSTGAGFLTDCQPSQSRCLPCLQWACGKGERNEIQKQLELMKKYYN